MQDQANSIQIHYRLVETYWWNKGVGRWGSEAYFQKVHMLVGWLGFTALQHFMGYIAPVSVVSVRMSARARLVGSYHLAPSNSG